MAESADFDGSADYMTRGAGLTGAADSKSGILSAWLRIDGSSSSSQYTVLGSQSQRFAFFRSATSTLLAVTGYSTTGTNILNIQTSATHTNSATWLHCLFSWDLSTTTGNLYINDVDAMDRTAGFFVLTNGTLDYTDTDWITGASSVTGSNKFDGCLAELYFAPGQYLDISIANNRRKFITASGKPVYLGTDGAGPTGTAPLVYFHLDPAETVADFATNRGTGGNFTITGSLSAGSTSPSDF